MGVLLDSTVLVNAERQGQIAHDVVASLSQRFLSVELALSVVTVAELTHGIVRAATQHRRFLRQVFLDELCSAMPVYPVTESVARVAGRLDGENAAMGFPVPFGDLLIAATALELNYAIATHNVRHFRLFSGLIVIPFLT